MKLVKKKMLAPCGLDCGHCDIRKVTIDHESAERIIKWYRNMGWLKAGEGTEEIIKRGMYCKGCRGDRSVHWSAECEILKCCVDEKGLEFCYECDEFVCAKLQDWVKDYAHHKAAIERLKRMRAILIE